MTISVVSLVTLLGGCKDDERVSAPASPYCALGKELDTRGERAFSPLTEASPPEEELRLLREFLQSNKADFTRLIDLAPREIREDVTFLVDAQQRAADTGNLKELEGEQYSLANDRVEQYEREQC